MNTSRSRQIERKLLDLVVVAHVTALGYVLVCTLKVVPVKIRRTEVVPRLFRPLQICRGRFFIPPNKLEEDFMGVFEELKARGLIAQMTDEEKIKDLLENHKIAFYIGFDPTADSLHVGHFVQMMVMAHMQKAGHTPIALFGGGTGMVGDPSGKSDMRKMLTIEEIDHNIACFKKQMSCLIDFSDGKPLWPITRTGY